MEAPLACIRKASVTINLVLQYKKKRKNYISTDKILIPLCMNASIDPGPSLEFSDE